MFLSEVMALAVVGVGIGLLIGAILPIVVGWLLAGLGLEPTLHSPKPPGNGSSQAAEPAGDADSRRDPARAQESRATLPLTGREGFTD